MIKNSILFFVALLLFASKAYSQSTTSLQDSFILVVDFSSAVVVNDSTYTVEISSQADQFGSGYRADSTKVGYYAIDSRGQLYTVDSVGGASIFMATLKLTEVSGSDGTPTGRGIVFKELSNGLIPTPPSNSSGIAPIILAKIITNNSIKNLPNKSVPGRLLLTDSGGSGTWESGTPGYGLDVSGTVLQVDTSSASGLVSKDRLDNALDDVVANTDFYQKRSSGLVMGNSTIWERSDGTEDGIHEFLLNARDSTLGSTVTNIAVGGDSASTQLEDFLALPVKDTFDYFIIQLGVNDLKPVAEPSSRATNQIQILIDSINSNKKSTAKIIIATPIPAKGHYEILYGSSDANIMKAKWDTLLLNIMNEGPIPITGVDYRISSHTTLLDDGTGSLKSIYDINSDGVHYGNVGRKIVADEWRRALENLGYLRPNPPAEYYTPSSTSDSYGIQGDIAYDDDYLYIKNSIGWERVQTSVFAENLIINEIDGIFQWYNADSLALSDGASITTLTDFSGNNIDYAQDTASYRPTYRSNDLNGHATIEFDGVDDYFYISDVNFTSDTVEIFAVVLPQSTEGSPTFIGAKADSSSYRVTLIDSTFATASLQSKYVLFVDDPIGTNYLIESNNPYTRNNWTLVNGFYDKSSLQITVNGSDTNSTSSYTGDIGNPTQREYVGAMWNNGSLNHHLNGKIAEIIVFNKKLSSTTRTNIINFLTNKYDLDNN